MSAKANGRTGTWNAKTGLARMLKGGVIMDVTTATEAKIAEEAGAVSVMALERVPADIRAQGGVARMSPVDILIQIKESVTIPVMAKCRIGHFVEARIIEALGLDYIDESEVLTVADNAHHVDKHDFTIPFVCGALDLGQALRRIGEGAAMIRTKGEAGTGDVVEAVNHMRTVQGQIRWLGGLGQEELMAAAKDLQAPYDLVVEVHRSGRLPVVNFAAGGIATPADAALMMHLGAAGIFVGSGIFKAAKEKALAQDPALDLSDPASDAAWAPFARRLARSIVEATLHYERFDLVAEAARGIDVAMSGIAADSLEVADRLAQRGH